MCAKSGHTIRVFDLFVVPTLSFVAWRRRQDLVEPRPPPRARHATHPWKSFWPYPGRYELALFMHRAAATTTGTEKSDESENDGMMQSKWDFSHFVL